MLHVWALAGEEKVSFHCSCKSGLAVINSLIFCLEKSLSLLHFWRTALLGKIFLAGSFFSSFFFFLFFLWSHLWHREVPRLGLESDLQLPVYATAIAMLDLSWICNWCPACSNPHPHGHYVGFLTLWITVGTPVFFLWAHWIYLPIFFWPTRFLPRSPLTAVRQFLYMWGIFFSCCF